MKKISLIFSLIAIVLFCNVSFGQVLYPGGDSCNTAVPIVVGDHYYTDADGCSDFDHWYKFIAPCDGALTVCNGGENEIEKRIYSGVCGSLTLISAATWTDDCTDAVSMAGGTEVYIKVEDSWDCEGQFDIEYTTCDVDSALLDVKGHVYYDMNNNGVRDGGEIGKFLNPIYTDPAGISTVTGVDGFYYASVAALDDGVYELYPTLGDHWGISSDSLKYTLNVDDTYEPRDSLDFGLYPDSIVYEVTPILIGGFPRCNDTINYSLSIQNTGTAIASGRVHLEIDDSLYYVTADVLPDSVVGQNLYWHYENIFYGEYDIITVQLGTPDGLEDTVLSTFNVTVDTGDVEMASFTDILEQEITCAYDPNDKTPKPLGEGPLGHIPPDTESIEYLIRFQNTGTDTAFNVVITDQLDENLDWYTITPLTYSHFMTMEMDIDGEVSFIFNNIMLPDSNVDYSGSQGFVKYRIDLKSDLPLGTTINNTANIYFDLNPAVVTNTTVNTLYLDDVSIEELMEEDQLLVYPNPFTESTTVYFAEDLQNYSVQIVDLLGKQVYNGTNLSGNKLEIEAGDFKQGMYILLLVDNESNQPVSTAKLIVK